MKDYEEFYKKYDRYISIVENKIHGDHIDQIDFVDYNLAKEELEEDELKILVIYSTFKKVAHMGNVEIMDIAEAILSELKELSLDIPASTTFIKSIFNFDSIYRPMYDLLSLAVDAKYRGKKFSEDYINGVIDSIIVLKRFQRTNGFGDNEWEIDWNTAIDERPK
jgi:hypothetical protein